jgi:hypothetical protein
MLYSAKNRGATKPYATGFIAAFILAALSGCGHTPAWSRLPEDNVRRLMERHDAQTARRACPGWTQDALLTISSLEHELALEKAKK